MFRSIKVSVTLGAAVLIASPGCCLSNLLCNHSSPSEETVVAGYSSEVVSDYSVVSSDCGCSCGSCGIGVDSGIDSGYSSVYEGEVNEADKYLISSPTENQTGAYAADSADSGFQPTLAETSEIAGSATKKVIDVVRPPVDLKTPLENALP